MISLLALLLWLALGLMLVPVLVLAVQVIAAWPRLGDAPPLTGRRPRLAVLIPAHNEAGGIGATLADLQPQMQAGDRIVVIADNCSDATADVARAAGAQVIERSSTTERGKSYALDFGVRHLHADAPEVVLIVDADCQVASGAIDRLGRLALETGRPVQARYLMHAPAGSGLMKKIAEFAWLVKNQVRPTGFWRLGLPCPLMGSGMAFPWAGISQADLASGHIVEDVKLGMDLARAGTPPLYCPHAHVSSTFPTSAAGTASQRTRWEHGHLGMIVAEGPALLLASARRRQLGLFALALDLCVPPVALLCLIVLLLSALAGVLALATEVSGPLLLAVVALGLLGAAIIGAWWRWSRHILSAGDLAMAFLYVFWKIPVYLRFAVKRQVEWVRSQRDHEQ